MNPNPAIAQQSKISAFSSTFERVFGKSSVPIEARALMLFVVMLETVAVSLLYFFPDYSSIYWPWVVSHPRSAMLISAPYIGGLVYYLPGLFAKDWDTVKGGVAGLIIFSVVLLVPNIVHWGLFRPYHPITLVWFAVYYALPLFVPVINRIANATPLTISADAKRISPLLNRWLVVRGGIYGALAILGLVFAESITPLWPWAIQPIDLRVFMAAVATVGLAGLLALTSDRLWQRHRLGAMSTGIMGLALLIALFINPTPYNWAAPLGIPLLILYLDWVITSGLMVFRYER